MPKTRETPVCALDGRCLRFRHFYPLLAFLIPTMLIGYGVVIPRSPIAGLNEFTIGFGSTLLGAAVAYWQGIRIALRRGNKSPGGKPCGDLIPANPSGVCVDLAAGSS